MKSCENGYGIVPDGVDIERRDRESLLRLSVRNEFQGWHGVTGR